jgi:hypothetical protein
VPDIEDLYYLMMHKQEIDVKDHDQNQKKQMFHDQFDVHLPDDIDHMVIEEIDQDDNHEVYQAKTYLHQSLAFVVR